MSTAAAPDTTGVIEKHKDGNDKSEHITHLDNVVRIIIVWSEWRESNPRPHGPEPCALPTALHPDTALLLYGIRFGMSRHIAENPRIELKEFNDGGQEG